MPNGFRARSTRVRALSAVAAAIVALAVLTAVTTELAPQRAGAAGRSLTVTPAAGLGNQAVDVSWSGFTPTTPDGLNQVIVVQCTEHPTSLADCFTAQPFPNSAEGNMVVNGVTSDNGTGSVRFEVRPAPKLPELGCSEKKPCSIVAFENQVVPEGQMPTSSASATIEFAHSADDCPKISNFDVRIQGEASGGPIVYGWAARRCTGNDPLIIDYTEDGSDGGRNEFLAGRVDVGLTSLPASPDELAAAPSHPAYAYAPIDLSAAAVVYNMNDPITNQPIDDLTLSPRLVARLISDTALGEFFQDPDFTRLNPAHTFPVNGVSTPLIRAEGNADTWITTNWIASNSAATSFLAGSDPDGVVVNDSYLNIPYPTSVFENRALDDAYLPRLGQANVATRVFYGARPTDQSPLDPASIGFIGVVDLATARRLDLPTARIVNAGGRAVAPTNDSILAGYEAMKPGADSTLVADPTADDPDAYPLVTVDYLMVPTKADEAHRHAIQDLLTWGVTAGQEDLPAGYLTLPDELVAQTQQVAQAVGEGTGSLNANGTIDGASSPPYADYSSAPYDSSSFSDGASGADLAADATGLTPAEAKKQRERALVAASSVAGAGARYVLPVLLALALAAALVVGSRRGWPAVASRRAGRARGDDPSATDPSR